MNPRGQLRRTQPMERKAWRRRGMPTAIAQVDPPPRRTAPIARRSPLPAATYTGPSAAERELVKARDEYACLTCGTHDGLVVNHRKTGMGGNRPQGPQWLTTACWLHNGEYESTRQAQAYAAGWKLRWGLDPTKTPVRDHLNRQWQLQEDGTRTVLPTEEDYIPDNQLPPRESRFR